VGIVEQGGVGGKQAFTCLEDLWGILNPPGIRKNSGIPSKESLGPGKEKPSNSKRRKGEKNGTKD
jgi:hypothetical protein